MKVRNIRNVPSRSTIARRAGTLPIAALLVTGALAGCSDDDSGAFDEFIGSWTIDFATSTFDLSCPAPNTTLSGNQPLWDVVLYELGTLTDLVEFGGPCPFKSNVTGKIATVADPDPFTNQPQICRLDIGDIPNTIFADIRPGWEFNLLKPEKGKAPSAQMVDLESPVSSLTVVRVIAGQEVADPVCTYVIQANLVKIAQF